MTDWALELSENPNTYVPLRPGHDRIVTARYVLWLGGGDHPGWNVAQRFRLGAGELGEVREEIHSHVRARGRAACSWEVGSSATPADLVERLLELGLVEDEEPLRVGMALAAPPAGVPELEVRRAESDDERRIAARIASTASRSSAPRRCPRLAAAAPTGPSCTPAGRTPSRAGRHWP